jgi:hypothetical protein
MGGAESAGSDYMSSTGFAHGYFSSLDWAAS